MKPPLKWAGGKRWQLPYLQRIWDKHTDRRLVEPFCGGMAIALGLNPQQVLANDINSHLINFYRWLKKGLRCHIEMRNEKTLFYEHRDRFNSLIRTKKIHTREAASLFYYLNRTGYNGLCRFNKAGQFNVPFGRYKTITYMNDFLDYRSTLKQWDFLNEDFTDLELHESDFVYADPPYDVDFTTYATGGFSWEDQIRTAECFAVHKGPVILVNQSTPRIKTLYRGLGYTLQFVDAPRRINATGDRTPSREVIAYRNL